MNLRLLALLAATVFFCGCTTIISEQSRLLVDTDADFTKIRQTPEDYIGRHLLAGGRIVNVRNSQSGAQLEIVQFELDNSGTPLSTYRSYGRFIATLPDYLEPVIYRRGMLITLVGEIKGKQTRRLDDMDYTYPVIAMREWYLWPGSEEDYGSPYPSPLPQYDPYNFGYGYEPFLPRPVNPGFPRR